MTEEDRVVCKNCEHMKAFHYWYQDDSEWSCSHHWGCNWCGGGCTCDHFEPLGFEVKDNE